MGKEVVFVNFQLLAILLELLLILTGLSDKFNVFSYLEPFYVWFLKYI